MSTSVLMPNRKHDRLSSTHISSGLSTEKVKLAPLIWSRCLMKSESIVAELASACNVFLVKVHTRSRRPNGGGVMGLNDQNMTKGKEMRWCKGI